MAITDYDKLPIRDFNGQWSRLEPTDVPVNNAIYSQNCEYLPGNVSTRNGFTSSLNSATAMSSMFNWVRNTGNNFNTGNALAYFATASTKARLLTDLAQYNAPGAWTIDLFTDASAATVLFTNGGTRLYCAPINTACAGTSDGRVVNDDTTTDRLFLGPLSTLPTLANTGTGVITAGTHRVGFVIQTRSGFIGRISPANSTDGTFNTASAIVAPGGRQINLQVTATWPAEAVGVYAVMTTADNLAQYFQVPGASYGVIGGLSSTVNININISDVDLKETGTDITQNQFFLTQDTLGNAPFYPFKIVEYGQRIVFLTTVGSTFKYYPSNIANPQQITADQHVRYLPGFRSGRSAFVLDGVLYVLGQNWTYADRDNTQVPVSWPTAELVDGQIGTLSPDGVTVNASKGFAWVAHTSGLYLFSAGRYNTKPVSYYQDDWWKRINWSSAWCVQVRDNKDRLQVYVKVPLKYSGTVSTSGNTATFIKTNPATGNDFSGLAPGMAITINNVGYTIATVSNDGQTLTTTTTIGTNASVAYSITPTTATHIFMWDYSNGLTPEAVKFSLWNIASYPLGCIEIVQNPTTQFQELWVGSTSASNPMRLMNDADSSPYNDNSAAIQCIYETALFPAKALTSIGMQYRHYAAHSRVTGSGTLNVTSFSIDRTATFSWLPITLDSEPTPFRRINLMTIGASHRFVTNAANQWFLLSGIDYYYAPGPSFIS